MNIIQHKNTHYSLHLLLILSIVGENTLSIKNIIVFNFKNHPTNIEIR